MIHLPGLAITILLAITSGSADEKSLRRSLYAVALLWSLTAAFDAIVLQGLSEL